MAEVLLIIMTVVVCGWFLFLFFFMLPKEMKEVNTMNNKAKDLHELSYKRFSEFLEYKIKIHIESFNRCIEEEANNGRFSFETRQFNLDDKEEKILYNFLYKFYKQQGFKVKKNKIVNRFRKLVYFKHTLIIKW